MISSPSLAPGGTVYVGSQNCRLYAAGDFLVAGGVAANHVAAWNGTGWSPLGSGVNGVAYALGLMGDYRYVGGEFDSAGGTTAHGIAQWKR